MTTTLQSWASSVLMVKSLENSIKQLQDHFEKAEYWNANNLQLESTNSDFVWESYGVWKVRKIERKFQHLRYSNFSSWNEIEGIGNI